VPTIGRSGQWAPQQQSIAPDPLPTAGVGCNRHGTNISSISQAPIHLDTCVEVLGSRISRAAASPLSGSVGLRVQQQLRQEHFKHIYEICRRHKAAHSQTTWHTCTEVSPNPISPATANASMLHRVANSSTSAPVLWYSTHRTWGSRFASITSRHTDPDLQQDRIA